MDEQEQNPFKEEKTPQQELEELLQKSKPRGTTTGIKIPGVSKSRGKINFLGLGIILLVLVLVVGTGYLILKSTTFNTLEVTFNVNENDVNLRIDDEGKGRIDSGHIITMRAGEYKILLTKDGFLELEENIVLIKNEDILFEFELLPIPEIERVFEQSFSSVRLSHDGSEISYFDESSGLFQSYDFETEEIVNLFGDNISGVVDVKWSFVAQSAVVKLTGRKTFKNMRDNRQEPGRYIPLGERPIQSPSNFNGISTWLFNDELRESSGWLPILLSDNIRQTAFGSDGSEIIYIHEPSDGEYSLIRAWPDGLEWERAVINMSRLSSPELIWGADDRYLLIKDEPRLLIADLISGEIIDSVFTDRLANSHVAISTDGDRVAYVASVGDSSAVRIYDFVNESIQTIGNLAIDANTVFTFTDNNTILISLPNSIFKKIDVIQDIRSTIPLIGDVPDSIIRQMDYSRAAKLLLLVTDAGVFKMRI